MALGEGFSGPEIPINDNEYCTIRASILRELLDVVVREGATTPQHVHDNFRVYERGWVALKNRFKKMKTIRIIKNA